MLFLRTMQGYHPDIDKKREECSSYGRMRYKEASMKVAFADGTRDFRYHVDKLPDRRRSLAYFTSG